jgi:polygalacturonase
MMRAAQCLPICMAVLVWASSAGIASENKDLSVMDYGAVADGKTLCTKAIQAAIDACSQRGGRLVFPSGRYMTGTFYIRARVELHLEKDAVILGSPDIKDYAADTGGIRYDNSPWMDRCLIYAEGADTISITGEGTLDGNGSQKNFPPGPRKGARPMLLRFLNCKNVVFRDITMRDPASWTCAIIGCENVEVRNLKINSRVNWNGDGLDFDSCRNVTVDNCEFNTSDDCICLQASEENRPCENIKITNCTFSTRWAAIRIGLLTRSDIRNVEMRDCHFHDVDGCGFKLQMAEGSVMESMLFENITMENVTRPVFITLNSHRFSRALKEAPLPPPGKLRNIKFVNIKGTAGNPAVKNAKAYMAIIGVPEQKIEDVEFRNVEITFPGGGSEATARRRDVPELGDLKPEFFAFNGDLPAYGLFIRHAKGVTLNHVKFRFKGNEKRPAILCDDVEEFSAPDLDAQCGKGVEPVVRY